VSFGIPNTVISQQSVLPLTHDIDGSPNLPANAIVGTFERFHQSGNRHAAEPRMIWQIDRMREQIYAVRSTRFAPILTPGIVCLTVSLNPEQRDLPPPMPPPGRAKFWPVEYGAPRSHPPKSCNAPRSGTSRPAGAKIGCSAAASNQCPKGSIAVASSSKSRPNREPKAAAPPHTIHAFSVRPAPCRYLFSIRREITNGLVDRRHHLAPSDLHCHQVLFRQPMYLYPVPEACPELHADSTGIHII